MSTARRNHTATLLNDGRVLVTGGRDNQGYLSTAEIFDPPTNSWSSAGSMSRVRAEHTATLLGDGRVLIVGGLSLPSVPTSGWTADAEIFTPTPTGGTWTSAGSMSRGSAQHTATALPDGRVLVAGGLNGTGNLASAEIYTPGPGTGTWTVTGSMAKPRTRHAAALVFFNHVLVAGGFNSTDGTLDTAERYIPTSGTWQSAGSMSTPRRDLTATALEASGKVLVAGGSTGGLNAPTVLTDAQVYTPGPVGTPGTWSSSMSMGTQHTGHAAALLVSRDRVLVAGGQPNGGVDSSIFFEGSSNWDYVGGMAASRSGFTLTTLKDGRVLAVGGFDPGTANAPAIASAEVFTG